MKKLSRKHHHAVRDVFIILFSIIIAIILARTGILIKFLNYTGTHIILSSFIAGMFWTSVFTVAPASVALLEIARANSIIPVAAAAALGAFLADIAIFRFIKDDLEQDIIDFIKHSPLKRLHVLWKLKSFRWLFSILGALIFASPLPDDIGIMIMGLSEANTHFFILTSVFLNFIGILTLILVFK